MVASYTTKFEHVIYRGAEGTLILVADKISFHPHDEGKKTVSWNWTAVKSHQEIVASPKPTWSMSVAIRGSFQETVQFELDSSDSVKKLQKEAYKRSGLANIIPVSPTSQSRAASAAKGGASTSQIEALKHQMFDSKESTASSKQKKDLDTLESVKVNELRKKLGAMLPAPPASQKQTKNEAPMNPFARKLQEARRSLNSSLQNIDFDPSLEQQQKKPAKIDPVKQQLLAAKLNLHHKQQPPELAGKSGGGPSSQPEDSPAKIDLSKQQALMSKLVFKKPNPTASHGGATEGSAFDRYQPESPPPIGETSDTSQAVRPVPLFLQELHSKVPHSESGKSTADLRSTSDSAASANQPASSKSSKRSRPPSLMDELQAKMSMRKDQPAKTVKDKDIRQSANMGADHAAGVPAIATLATATLRQSQQDRNQAPPPLKEVPALASLSNQGTPGGAATTSTRLPPSPSQTSSQGQEEGGVPITPTISQAAVVAPVLALVATTSSDSMPASPSQTSSQGDEGGVPPISTLSQAAAVATSAALAIRDSGGDSMPLATGTDDSSNSESTVQVQDDTQLVMVPQSLEEVSGNLPRQPSSLSGSAKMEVVSQQPMGQTSYDNSEGKNSSAGSDHVKEPYAKAAGLGPPPDAQKRREAKTFAIVIAALVVIIVVVAVVIAVVSFLPGPMDGGSGSESNMPAPGTTPPVFPTPNNGGSIPTVSPGMPTPIVNTLAPSIGGTTSGESSAPIPTTPGISTNAPSGPEGQTGISTGVPSMTSTNVEKTVSPSAVTAKPGLTEVPTLVSIEGPSAPQIITTEPSLPIEQPTQSSTEVPSNPIPVEAGLPEYTQVSLQDPTSPQSLARDWLLEDPSRATYEDWRQLQRFALGTFFFAFNGEEWPQLIRDSWMQYDSSECDWFSDTHSILFAVQDGTVEMRSAANASACNDQGRYTSLVVYDGSAIGTPFHDEFANTFIGTMPPEVSLLTSLERIGLQTDTSILGVSMGDLLPPQFQDFTNLTELDMSNSNLKEWNITALLNLPSLVTLDISNNAFEGPITTELGLLTDLQFLDVSHSYRNSSQIPSEMGQMTELVYLSLAGNTLAGDFPAEFGFLEKLESLDLRNSGISSFPPATLTNLKRLDMAFSNYEGTIPLELGFFTSLQYLDLSNSGLTGTLPVEIGLLTNLEFFSATQNSLTGTLPEELGLATSLMTMDFEANQFVGSLSPFVTLSLRNLQFFDLGSNAFSGNLPTELGALRNLTSLTISDNLFSGPLPSHLGQLERLAVLDVARNALVGGIPWYDLAGFTELTYFDAGYNNLTGTIATDVGIMTDLSLLSVMANDLTGNLPTEVGQMRALAHFDAAQNRIDGPMPSQLGLLDSTLLELILDWNLLSSSIPTEVGLLTSLEILTARGYSLTGPIPEEIGFLTRLEMLLFGGNPFTGTLPTTLGLLSSNLKHLSLNLTTIGGTIPSELGLLTHLEILYLNGTNLAGTVPVEVCALSLDMLAVDCVEVSCDCNCDCFG